MGKRLFSPKGEKNPEHKDPQEMCFRASPFTSGSTLKAGVGFFMMPGLSPL